MKKYKKLLIVFFVIAVVVMSAIYPQSVLADTAAEIDRDVDAALDKLYSREPAAKDLATDAKGILIFPSIVKGGLIVGGQYGEGALRVKGKTVAYYNNVAVS